MDQLDSLPMEQDTVEENQSIFTATKSNHRHKKNNTLL